MGYAEDDGKLIVVAEDGANADWVRNALERGGRLRVFVGGSWRDARLRLVDVNPEDALQRMSRLHGALVRAHSSTPGTVELALE